MRFLVSWPGVSVLTIMIALPTPIFGQTPNPADLVGTWVVPRAGEKQGDSLRKYLVVDVLTFNTDGTATEELQRKDGDRLIPVRKEASRGLLHWDLTGDTLRFRTTPSVRPLTYIVQRQNRHLLFWDELIWDAGRHYPQCADKVYDRFESVSQLAMPPPPRVTINPADLVGTWAGTFDTRMWGTVTDTLVIGADYTLRAAHVGPVDDVHSKGTWALLPGDVLTGPLGNIDRVKITLQHGKLVRCHYNYAILRRIAP